MSNTSWKDSYQHDMVNAMRAEGPVIEKISRIMAGIVDQVAGRAGGRDEVLIENLEEVLDWSVARRVEAGGDSAKLVKGLLLGCVRSERMTETGMRRAYGKFAEIFFRDVLQSGAPVEKCCVAFVHGAVEAARERHWSAEESASAAATGAVNALYRNDPTAGDLGREILQGKEINGTTVQLRETEKWTV